MKKEDLITVIVPIYNVEKYLDRCIESIIKQTYDNLEIILVNDGSIDNCAKICDVWAEKDSRIIVIHQENRGISNARNKGLELAKGQYIGFVDSDDYIASNMYEILYSAIKRENADLAICNYKKILENGVELEKLAPVKGEVFTGKQGLSKLSKIKSSYYTVMWNKLYSRNSLCRINMPDGKIFEDVYVAHEILWNCNKIVSLEEKLYNYVQRKGSIIHSDVNVRYLDCVEALYLRILFYEKHNFEEGIPATYSDMRRRYIRYNKQMKILYEKKERARIKEINKMYKEVYLKYGKKSVKEQFLADFPQFVLFYMRLKTKYNMRTKIKCNN